MLKHCIDLSYQKKKNNRLQKITKLTTGEIEELMNLCLVSHFRFNNKQYRTEDF